MSEEVKKYKCPACGAIITNKMSNCPKCNKKFSWSMSTGSSRKDTTSDFLLKYHYWFRTLNFFFPWASLVLLFTNKSYATSINSSKVNCYAGFKKHTAIACAIHFVLVFGIIIYGLSMLKEVVG